jgi:hypothetical protein
MLKYMKSLRVVAEVFIAGGRTDMTKVIVAFRNFVNAPKNYFLDMRKINGDLYSAEVV